VSTNPIWAKTPFSYGSHVEAFTKHFRVIAPDTRGAGRTVNPSGGPASFAQLVDDVMALSEALGLDRPAICGFSEGGITATIAGIRYPERVRAIVNDAGYDMFNPAAPTFTIMRQILGGSPTATQADPVAFENGFHSSEQMRGVLEMLKLDHEAAQGAGYLTSYISDTFDRITQSPGFTFEDFARITAPMLILVGDRDDFCSPEEGVVAYRTLQSGELAILPGTGHVTTPQKVQIAIDFLRRHA
jgi:pimeloyl-ACP methyl ester carboxylesterase